MARKISKPSCYGLLAEFTAPPPLVKAVEEVRKTGYRKLDAFSPYPVDDLTEALGFHYTRVPLITLLGGLAGGLSGYGLQYWISAVEYPINVGGRPLHSWPAFIPVTFELAILGAALAAVLGMLALNGLPMPYHPLFHVPKFALASRDRFFLLIESRDPLFDAVRTRQLLESLGSRAVYDVPY
jgi:hypothetical protein